MQLYALDSQSQPVFAGHAKKQCDYTCLECGSPVRRRGGIHRKDHFYHLDSTHHCRQNGKSMAHLQAQFYVQRSLPEGDCHLEHHFPRINRIADAAWLSKKVVFEIQCSPISAEEVKSRNMDYASVGWQVVWVLHDRQFNQWRVTAAERFLRDSPHYFTNLDEEGNGMIFDQYDWIERGIRSLTLPPCPIEISKPIRGKAQSTVSPLVIRQRLLQWPVHFGGDLVDLYLNALENPQVKNYFVKVQESERASVKRAVPVPFWKRLLYFGVVRPYTLFFQILLERACK